MSLHTYSFPEPWYSGKYIEGHKITAVLTKAPSEVRTEVRLSVPAKKVLTVRSTRYAGDKLTVSNYTLADFVIESVDEPTIETRFETSTIDFKKIDCIKAVREVMGYGLKEAKDFVEAVGMMNATIVLVDFKSHASRW